LKKNPYRFLKHDSDILQDMKDGQRSLIFAAGVSLLAGVVVAVSGDAMRGRPQVVSRAGTPTLEHKPKPDPIPTPPGSEASDSIVQTPVPTG